MWVPIGSTSLFPLSPHLIYECISMATTFSMSCQKMQIIFDGNQFCQVYLSLLSFSVFQYFWHQVLLRNFASSLLSNLFLSYNHKQSTSCSWGLRLIKLLRGWYIAFLSQGVKLLLICLEVFPLENFGVSFKTRKIDRQALLTKISDF